MTQKWIDIDDGKDFWWRDRGRVILLWQDGNRAKVGIGSFSGDTWEIEGTFHRYKEGSIRPTHFIPLPDKPDNYDDWVY